MLYVVCCMLYDVLLVDIYIYIYICTYIYIYPILYMYSIVYYIRSALSPGRPLKGPAEYRSRPTSIATIIISMISITIVIIV